MSFGKASQEDLQSDYKVSFDKSQTDCVKTGTKKNGNGIYPSQGAWTRMEQIAYFNFIIKHAEVMECSRLRKKLRMFRKMGEAVGTRRTVQCKSHHQKMMISHSNNFKRLVDFGKEAYLSWGGALSGQRIKVVEEYSESQALFYRMYRSGSSIKIILNDHCINTYQ